MQATAMAASEAGSRRSRALSLVGPALLAHSPLFAVLAVHIGFAAALKAAYPDMATVEARAILVSLLVFVLAVIPFSLVALRLFHVARYENPKHPIPALARDIWSFVTTPTRFVNGAIIVALYVPFITTFSYLKNNITIIQPFSWDVAFNDWDRWLFLGYLPWELLQPLLGFPLVTFVINIAYNLWFFVMWLAVVAFAFAKAPTALRMQFFLSYMLVWSIGGNLLAIVFSSAGPCFYGLLDLTPNPYAPLMSYLGEVRETFPIWALDTQALLWAGYQGQTTAMGISAMPSMHNATCLLLALMGFKVDRRLGCVLSAFAAMIFVGSLMLAWHYAVDAFLAYAIVLVAWIVAGRFARWWDRQSPTVHYASASARATPA